MGKKTVHVSDFTGTLLGPDDEIVRVVVLEHPDLLTGPVQLDALPVEVESMMTPPWTSPSSRSTTTTQAASHAAWS